MYDLAVFIARSTINKTPDDAVALFVRAVHDFDLDWPEQVVLVEEHRRAAPLVALQAARSMPWLRT